MKVNLVSSDPLALCRLLELSTFPVVIGRGEVATVRIDDRWLSRAHCELRCENDVLVVRDLGSKHGTFVNGQRISEARLESGDVLAIALCHFVATMEANVPDSAVAVLA